MDNISILQRNFTKQATSFNNLTNQKTVRIMPMSSQQIVCESGVGIVKRLWLTFPGWFWRHWDESAQNDAFILRTSIIEIYFDNCEGPSVSAPIGDFFGVGHCEYKPFSSEYIGMTSGGFYCYFPMPFNTEIKIIIKNTHKQIPIDLFYNLEIEKPGSLPQNSGIFHAQFNCKEIQGDEELLILDAKNEGNYVGCALSIQGKPMQYLAYLEAPEYIYIDDNPQLSIIGTGMEDYFNGGWYFRNGEFCAPTHGVPLKDTLRSMVSMYRLHYHDKIYFNKSFRMVFKNPWPSERLQPLCYSSVAYFYMNKPQAVVSAESNDLSVIYRVRDTDFQSVP